MVYEGERKERGRIKVKWKERKRRKRKGYQMEKREKGGIVGAKEERRIGKEVPNSELIERKTKSYRGKGTESEKQIGQME